MLEKLKFLPLFLLLIFASCNNLFENPSEKNHNTSERKYITVTGSLNLGGAFPAEFIQMYQRQAELVSSDTSRTAFPTIPSFSTTDFTVEAINTSDSNDKYTGSVSSELNSYTYTIGIPIADSEKKYKIKITAKNSFGICMTGETPDPVNSPVTVSLTNPVTQNHSITLKASQNSESIGRMELPVTIASDSGIHSARVRYENGVTHCYNVSGTSCIFSIGSVNEQGALTMGIQGGTYPLTFEFFSGNLTSDDPPECSGNLLYSFTETVNIFANMNTNTWVQNGNEPWFTTTGTGSSKVTTCSITKDMVDRYALTQIWVDPTAANDNGYGSFFSPKKTLAGALSLLHDAGKDYTIIIKGECTGSSSIPVTLKKTGSGGTYTYAHSLTICGYTGLDENGIPQDSLNGNGSGPVLSILTDVPVTIKNLKIYGGSTTGNGGGINISRLNASVTLTDGALITDNQATCGGGVFLNSGNLFVYGSAVIGKSGVSSHAGTTSGNYGNKATTSGGGIGVGSGTLWLGYSGENIPAETSGGVIYNLVMGDSETHGGGIDNRNGTVNIARGNVSYNYACCSSGSTATGCGGGISTARTLNLTGTAVIEENYSSYGGGVYITKDSNNGHLIMTGGTIRLNHAEKERPLITSDSWGDGGGVAIGSNASFTISGGTISTNYAQRCGGAVVDHFGTAFNIKGSAYIPYDSVHSCNDVYIESGKTIALSESLSPPEACTDADGIIAQITPSAYTEDTTVFTISSPATSAELSYFKVTPNGTQDWRITTEGKMREGVVLPSSYSSMESGKTYFVSGSSGIGTIAEFSSSGYDFSGVKLKLESNVTISTTWTPIGDATAFSGTFDGNGKTVTFAAESNAEAFFGTVNGNVKNLKVDGSASVAGIAKNANSSAVIENCENSATVTSSTTQDYCAGIVAEVYNATIKGCVNKGAITSNYVLPADNYANGAGGVAGFVNSGGIIDSCVNEGNVIGPNAGGITAHIDNSNSTIRNAYNSGNVTSTERHAGGISGVSQGSGGGTDKASHIYNCCNSGSVSASGTVYTVYAGGIVGKHGWGNTSWAQNCLNIGNVSISESAKSGSHAGALFGIKDGWSQIDFCYYKEGCAGSSFGIGGSTSDTANECIKATQSGTANAVISAEVTLNETTYSADSSTVLSVLNAWVSANSTGGLSLVWESDTNHWPKLKTE